MFSQSDRGSGEGAASVNAKLTDDERKIAENALAVADEPRRLFDVANAERFAEQHRSLLKYCEMFGGWLIWQGKYWRADPDDQVMGFAIKTAESLWAEVVSARGDQRAAAYKVYAYAQRRSALRAMIDLAKHKLAAATDLFDRDPFALNCLNGTVDLRTGKIRPHDPADFITKLIELEYDPKATGRRWRQFLAEVLPDQALLLYVQRAIGYSLTADQRVECLFVAVGGGANGKGVFIDMIRAVIGPYGSAGRPELLIHKRVESTNNEDVALLRGQRFVEVSETGEKHELNEEQVKNLTGQDAIRASFKYESLKNTEFRPTHHIWLRTNNKPIIRGGTDYAIWRRLKVIPFAVTFYTKSEYDSIIKVDPKRTMDRTLSIRDDTLRESLREEVQGILAWAIKGAVLWFNRGKPDLREPKIVTGAVEEYRSEMDRLGQFIDECCERAANVTTPLKVLYSEYKRWATEKGWKPWGDNTLSRHLGKAGFKMKRDNTGSQCGGLKLKSTAAEENTEKKLKEVAAKVIPIGNRKKKYAR
jgi:putative DNA primase/helicase